MNVAIWEWGIIGIIVVALILFDLIQHVRSPHESSLKEAAIYTGSYVGMAIIFALWLVWRHGQQFGLEFIAGYLTEYSISLDNIFVFIIVMASFKVPRIYQQKVLMYGIVIALILRFVFILAGAALVSRFAWVFFIFGAWMLYVALKQVKDALATEETQPEETKPTFLTRLASKVFRVKSEFVSDKILVKESGKIWITPLMLCVVSIGSIDIMFALDSIPAIFGLTHEPFIVFASNAFALLGLRQLFFLVDGLLDRLVFLNFGLAAILAFIGYKLIVHACHAYSLLEFFPEPSSVVSVLIIAIIVLITVIASLLRTRRISR